MSLGHRFSELVLCLFCGWVANSFSVPSLETGHIKSKSGLIGPNLLRSSSTRIRDENPKQHSGGLFFSPSEAPAPVIGSEYSLPELVDLLLFGKTMLQGDLLLANPLDGR